MMKTHGAFPIPRSLGGQDFAYLKNLYSLGEVN